MPATTENTDTEADVTVVGSVNVDVVIRVPRIPTPGETVLGSGLRRLPGGKGANQALAAARAGARTRFIAAVGEDGGADLALSALRAEGLDLDAVIAVPGTPTGLASIYVDDAAENSIVVVAGANGHLDAAAVRTVAGRIEGTLVLQGEIPRSGVEAAVRAAPSRVVLNLAPVIGLDPEVVRAADPLVVNEHEAEAALAGFGRTCDGDERATAAALLDAGVTSVVITLGARGALVADGGGLLQVPSPRVEAVDSTGAGDAFVGALAARLSRGEPLPGAAAYACRFAAAAVRGEGAQPSYPVRGAELPEV